MGRSWHQRSCSIGWVKFIYFFEWIPVILFYCPLLSYQAVQSVNMSHDLAHAQMDIKFRSLICVGLKWDFHTDTQLKEVTTVFLEAAVLFDSVVVSSYSEQVLHLWLEVLCSSVAAVEKWYHPWSFLRSPGWVQIKCELRWEAHRCWKCRNKALTCVVVCCLLRVLSKFAFSLSQDCELPDKKEVREWDLGSRSRHIQRRIMTSCCFRNQLFWKQKLWICWFSITSLVGTPR